MVPDLIPRQGNSRATSASPAIGGMSAIGGLILTTGRFAPAKCLRSSGHCA